MGLLVGKKKKKKRKWGELNWHSNSCESHILFSKFPYRRNNRKYIFSFSFFFIFSFSHKPNTAYGSTLVFWIVLSYGPTERMLIVPHRIQSSPKLGLPTSLLLLHPPRKLNKYNLTRFGHGYVDTARTLACSSILWSVPRRVCYVPNMDTIQYNGSHEQQVQKVTLTEIKKKRSFYLQIAYSSYSLSSLTW